MKDLETKKNVLQEIMDLMDGRDGERLKSHPKVAAKFAPKTEPKVEETEELEIADESEAEEMPSEEKAEGELSDEDIQLLMEKLKDLE